MPEGKMRHPAVLVPFARTKDTRASKARKLSSQMARQIKKTRHSYQAATTSASITGSATKHTNQNRQRHQRYTKSLQTQQSPHKEGLNVDSPDYYYVIAGHLCGRFEPSVKQAVCSTMGKNYLNDGFMTSTCCDSCRFPDERSARRHKKTRREAGFSLTTWVGQAARSMALRSFLIAATSTCRTRSAEMS